MIYVVELKNPVCVYFISLDKNKIEKKEVGAHMVGRRSDGALMLGLNYVIHVFRFTFIWLSGSL